MHAGVRSIALLCVIAASLLGQAQGDAAGAGNENSPRAARGEECLRNPDAFCILDEAFDLTRTIKDASSRAWRLAAIAETQARGGRRSDARQSVDKALGLARGITDDVVRNLLLMHIWRVLVAAGDLSTADSIMRDFPDDMYRAVSLANLAEIQIEKGEVHEARQTMRVALEAARGTKWKGEDGSAWEWTYIAQLQVKVRNEPEAREALAIALDILERKRTDDFARSNIMHLSRVAISQGKLGSQHEARQTLARAQALLRRVKDNYERNAALSDLVEGYAGTGNVRAALDTSRRITDPERRAMALASVARAQGEAGKQREARRLIGDTVNLAAGVRKKIGDGSCDCALGEIMEAQLDLGHVNGALDTARLIEKKVARVAALVKIARAQMRNGSTPAARESVKEALDIARRIDNNDKTYSEELPEIRAEALTHVARGLLELGEKRP